MTSQERGCDNCCGNTDASPKSKSIRNSPTLKINCSGGKTNKICYQDARKSS